jgi:Zn finger protein HypA/HybF involved in hydrogenase expression
MERVTSAATKPIEDSPLRIRVGAQDIEATMCATCGTQFPPESEPERCPICEDKRQYVGQDGQSWTSIAELHAAGRRDEIRELEPG